MPGQDSFDRIVNEEAMRKKKRIKDTSPEAAQDYIEEAKRQGKPLEGSDFKGSKAMTSGLGGLLKKDQANPKSYAKGGEVKKGGFALVHKGEKVLTKDQQKKKKFVFPGGKGNAQR